MSRLSSFLVNQLAGCELLSHQQRLKFYKKHGLRVFGYAHIDPRVYFHIPDGLDLRHLEIRDNAYIGSFTYIDTTGHITISQNTRISHHVSISTVTHGKGFPHSSSGAIVKPVYIGRDSVIYSNVQILPGAHIGDRAVIAAGSVILQDQVIPDDSFYAGVPAKGKTRTEVMM